MNPRKLNSPLLRCAIWMCVVTLAFGAFAYLGIHLTRGEGRIAAVWVPNAIMLVGIMRARRQAKPFFFATCLTANIGANLLIGDAGPVAIALACINSLEVFVVWHLLKRFGFSRPAFVEFDEIKAFGLAVAIAVSISSIAASSAMAIFNGIDPLALAWKWFRADAMGLLIVVPALMILGDGWQKRNQLTRDKVLAGLLVIGIGSTISAYTFYQTRFPLLFLDAPLVLFYAYRLGAIGNAIAILNLAVVAIVATAYGHGPISLVRGDLTDKLFVLQVFLASSFMMGLPVAALLKAKQKAEERFRLIAELSPVGIFQTDAQLNLRYGNSAFRSKIGTEEEMYGSPIWDAIGFLGKAEQNEFTALDERSGRTLKVKTQALADEAGEPDGILGAMVDISAEVSARKKLEDAKRSFETLTELSPAGITRATADGSYTYVNKAWQALSGIDAFCATGKGWMAAVHPDDRDRVSDAWYDSIEAGASLEIDYRFLKEDGTINWIKALSRPDIANDGTVTGFIGVALDITDRMSTEAELIKAKLGADEAAMSKAQFLANMSHEIRTPMNGVLGFAQMLSREDLTERQHQHVQMIIQSGSTMLALLNDILDVSKIEAGRMDLHFEAMDVRQQVNTCIDGLRSLADAKNIALHGTVSTKVPDRIECDPLRFRQILNNIIGNAIKFTDEGHVSVSISSDELAAGNVLLVRVSDSGIGIAPDKLEAIFGYFDQAETTVTTRFGGTGLGLAITKNLIEKFGGSVEVQSDLGFGSTFFIRLPFETTICEGKEGLGEPSKQSESPFMPSAATIELLVAEDNEVNIAVLQAMLDRLGVEATVARDGEQAVSIIQQARAAGLKFDLVLMDMRMPVMDGLEATRQLRELGFGAEQLPIIALTANSFAEDKAACLDAGMQGHLAKPLEFERLQDLLRTYGRAKSDASDRLTEVTRRLAGKFETQKARVLNMVAAIIKSDKIEVPEGFETDLHQLAGTAGYFDQSDFGLVCREAEAALRKMENLELKGELERLFAVHLNPS